METKSSRLIDFLPDREFATILTNPILDIAARFWDESRYNAFRLCYRSMRIIDDLVDDRKASPHQLPTAEKEQLRRMISQWVIALQNGTGIDNFQKELLEAIKKYRIPIWPWQRLAKAMIYDLDHSGFDSFLVFLRYSEGAAIAPASIFMHLCGVRETAEGFAPPEYGIRQAARPLALFSYLVHIVRDFQKDQLQGLNYIPGDLLHMNCLTEEELREIAESEQMPVRFLKLVGFYRSAGDYYRKRARRMVQSMQSVLSPRSQLSLEVIYDLYLQIFQRIQPSKQEFSISSDKMNPSPDQVQERLESLLKRLQA